MNAKEIDSKRTELLNAGYKHHHDATARGYITKCCGYIEEYTGRFGTGYKIVWPNCSFRSSNSVHYVEYIIKKN